MSDTDSIIAKGQKYLMEGNFKKAKTEFTKAIKLEPENPEGHFGLAEASVGIPKMSMVEVAQLYKKAISLDPENVFYLTSYGDFCLSNGLLPQAEEQYKKAAQLDPENSMVYYSDLAAGYYKYGIIFLDRQLDMDREAIARRSIEFSFQALGLDPKAAKDFLNNMASSKTEEAEFERLAKDEMDKVSSIGDAADLQKILKKEPDNPYLRMELGALCFESSYLFAGEKYFLEAIELDPKNAANIYTDLAVEYYRCGRSLCQEGKIEESKVLQKSLRYLLDSLGLDAARTLNIIDAR